MPDINMINMLHAMNTSCPMPRINIPSTKSGILLKNKWLKSACKNGEQMIPANPGIERGYMPRMLSLEPVIQLIILNIQMPNNKCSIKGNCSAAIAKYCW